MFRLSVLFFVAVNLFAVIVCEAQQVQEVIEYVTVQEKICDGGVCRIVNVTRPVRRLVAVPVKAAGAVISSLADAASAPVCGCGCNLAGCNCGLGQATPEVASVVDYAEVERVSGLRFIERVRQRLFWRRQGRNQAVANFATTGINTRLRGLSLFFPRAWFNLR